MKPKLTKPDIYSNCCLECGFPSLTAHYDGCSKTTKPEESVKESGWEKKLGEIFEQRGFYPFYYLEEYAWLYDFIRQLLAQAREEERKECLTRFNRELISNEVLRDVLGKWGIQIVRGIITN